MSSEKPIVILGAGLAGVCAAFEAEKRGKQVIVIDKDTKGGGNSTKASSGISCFGSSFQKEQGIVDSKEAFLKDFLKSAAGLGDEELADILVTDGIEVVDWFRDTFKIDLCVISQCGGHSAPRTHKNPGGIPVGYFMYSTVLKQCEAKENIKFYRSTIVKNLIIDNGSVVGVHIEREGNEEDLYASSVIICTGGYQNDHTKDSLLVKYCPQYEFYPTTSAATNTGDGIKLCSSLHPLLLCMDIIQVHPTAFVPQVEVANAGSRVLAPEALRGVGGIMRFVNELQTRKYVVDKIDNHITNKDKHSYLILDENMVKIYGEKLIAFYLAKGFIVKYENAAALDAALKLTEGTIQHTLEEYNANAAKGCDETDKTVFPNVFHLDQSLYVGITAPALHYCVGGLAIDKEARCLNENKQIIPGLYAAGEVCGGIHGGNRLAGCSLLDCVVFGRRAGEYAN
ncbi:hypothetical protein WA158_003642 [Blastocystis sp. Blastoise]